MAALGVNLEKRASPMLQCWWQVWQMVCERGRRGLGDVAGHFTSHWEPLLARRRCKRPFRAAMPLRIQAVEEICNDNSQEGARDEVEGSFRPTGRHCYPGEISEGCTLRNFEWQSPEDCRPFFTNSWFNRDFRQFSRHTSFFLPIPPEKVTRTSFPRSWLHPCMNSRALQPHSFKVSLQRSLFFLDRCAADFKIRRLQCPSICLPWYINSACLRPPSGF